MSKVVLWLLCLLPTFSLTVTKSWHSGTMCYVLQHSSTLVLFTMHYAHTVFMLCKVRIYCATYTYIVFVMLLNVYTIFHSRPPPFLDATHAPAMYMGTSIKKQGLQRKRRWRLNNCLFVYILHYDMWNSQTSINIKTTSFLDEDNPIGYN